LLLIICTDGAATRMVALESCEQHTSF